jgi:hypothetical protein
MDGGVFIERSLEAKGLSYLQRVMSHPLGMRQDMRYSKNGVWRLGTEIFASAKINEGLDTYLAPGETF